MNCRLPVDSLTKNCIYSSLLCLVSLINNHLPTTVNARKRFLCSTVLSAFAVYAEAGTRGDCVPYLATAHALRSTSGRDLMTS